MPVVTFSTSAPNHNLTLQSEEEDGVIGVNRRVSVTKSTLQTLVAHLRAGCSRPKVNLTRHFSYIHRLTCNPGLRNNGTSQLDTSGAPIKPHI